MLDNLIGAPPRLPLPFFCRMIGKLSQRFGLGDPHTNSKMGTL
ncbi:Uncharacterised protein [Shigella dysenteriae]|uniref:Uncharacterized protein n=1 Tax=Shigella dysenteriae TaxID=622 RepID=A0A3P6L387_SHIDY|nr:Uncharacterised protein [Shigella dysenteriae]